MRQLDGAGAAQATNGPCRSCSRGGEDPVHQTALVDFDRELVVGQPIRCTPARARWFVMMRGDVKVLRCRVLSRMRNPPVDRDTSLTLLDQCGLSRAKAVHGGSVRPAVNALLPAPSTD